tara:strand:- start:105 stop:443 length:339 start_codon:yes stop_codon:yes gene_type:complete
MNSYLNKKLNELSNTITFETNKEIVDILKKCEQTDKVKFEIGKILEESRLTFELNAIECSFRIGINITYHLYENNNKKYFSLIGPSEWKCSDTYVGGYKLNSKLSWVKVTSH